MEEPAEVFAVIRVSHNLLPEKDPRLLCKVVEVLPNLRQATKEMDRLNSLKVSHSDTYITQRSRFLASKASAYKALDVPEQEPWFDKSGQSIDPKYLTIGVLLRANILNAIPGGNPHEYIQIKNLYMRWEDAFDEAENLNVSKTEITVVYFAESTHWYPNGREVNSN